MTQNAHLTDIHVQDPTGPGEIGVNPVEVVTETNYIQINTKYLTGDPQSYVGIVGTDSNIVRIP